MHSDYVRFFRLLVLAGILLLSSCLKAPEEIPPPPPPPPPPVEIKAPPAVSVDWAELPDWSERDHREALATFLKGCSALRWRKGWVDACTAAREVDARLPDPSREFFETYFRPWRLQKENGSGEGLLTGYYVPDLAASRQPTERYRFPLYGVPDDLLVVDLASVYPELGNYRLRGRIEGRRVVPYWDRSEIESGKASLDAQALFWVEDPVDLFFLQIQGSGRLQLTDGTRVLVNYADQNGHPFRSIGKLLLQRGAMTREQMSMQNIRAWAKQHPGEVGALLNENPSYVFFRELPPEVQSPPGAFGVPLTPGYSLAVDPRFIPLGAPVYLATTWPGIDQPLIRVMVAQDTGGAIKGAVRGDFFWGMGDAAGELAGRMKQPVRLWLLLPDGVAPNSLK